MWKPAGFHIFIYMVNLKLLFSHDDVGDGGDLSVGDGTVAVEVGILLGELRRGLSLLGIDHLHKVGGIHLFVAVGIAPEADIHGEGYRLLDFIIIVTNGIITCSCRLRN